MIILDTSIWIEYLIGSDKGRENINYFSDLSSIIVPTTIVAELYKWISREINIEAADLVMEVLQNCKIVNLDIEISLLSARLSNIHKLSFVDSTIYATAQFYEAQLITFDKHFKDLDNVIYFQK